MYSVQHAPRLCARNCKTGAAGLKADLDIVPAAHSLVVVVVARIEPAVYILLLVLAAVCLLWRPVHCPGPQPQVSMAAWSHEK